MDRTVAAIVVTHNRKDMLRRCIDALEMQSCADSMGIIVVDNGSSDGTDQFMEDYGATHSSVRYFNTGENLGGAGGFAYGMRQAAELGYEYMWLMDDDCIPDADALEHLMEYGRQHRGEYGFLSSRVNWTDGTPAVMNVQRKTVLRKVDRRALEGNRDKSLKEAAVPIAMASFVSLWVPTEVVREVGLPIKEFFIWTDDWEFTRRISRRYPCCLIPASTVTHATVVNCGADIASADEAMLHRFRYLYRNDVVLYRREGLKGYGYEAVRLAAHGLRIATRSRNLKMKRLGIMLGATLEGLKFDPEIEYL